MLEFVFGDRSSNVRGSTDKAKAMRQSKTVPSLIFSIEQFDRFLLQVSCVTKRKRKGKIKAKGKWHFFISVTRRAGWNIECCSFCVSLQEIFPFSFSRFFCFFLLLLLGTS